MITCPNCGKENQDHYKFCLGCGSKLPQPGAAPPAPVPPQAAAPTPPPPRPSAPPPPPPPRASGSTGAPPSGNRIASSGAPTGPIGAPRQPASFGGAPQPPAPPAPMPIGSAPTGAMPVQPSGPTASSRPQQNTAPQPVAPQTNGPMPPPPLGPPQDTGLPMQFAASGSGGTIGSAPTGAPVMPTPAAGTCSSCGFQSPPGFAFCGRCGTPLAAAPVATPADVGSAQTIFVGNARDVATPEPPPPMQPPPMQAPPMQAQPMPQPEMAPPPVAPQPIPPQPEPAPHLGVAAPVVGSSGTAPGSQSPPVPPVAPGVPVRLVMLGPDGQPIGERVLAGGEAIDVGRDAGPPWDDDAYLDPKHATMRAAEAGVMVEDHNSLNGIFVKLTGRTELRSGDQFRVGQELLAYEELPEPTPTDDGTERMGSPNPGYWGRVSVLVDPSMASSAFAMAGEGLGIGREIGEITFPTDGYVSGRHCRIVGDDTGIYLEDLGSSNGTYMRVRSGQVLPFGSLVLIGQKLFQLERA